MKKIYMVISALIVSAISILIMWWDSINFEALRGVTTLGLMVVMIFSAAIIVIYVVTNGEVFD